MSRRTENDEIRWQVIKAMLEEFPTLREKVKAYIEEQNRNRSLNSSKRGFFSKGVAAEP